MPRHSRENLQPVFTRHARRPFRILLDENVSPRLRAAIPAAFAETILMKSAGLKGRDDRDVWDWAIRHRCDAIITHDCRMKEETDLTMIAVGAVAQVIGEHGYEGARLNALPLVIHLERKRDAAAELQKIMDRFAPKLADYIRDIRKSAIPYIHISAAGIKPGRSWPEIAFEDDERNRRDRSRTEQFEKKWKSKILSRMGEAFDKAKMAGLETRLHEAALACIAPMPRRSGPSFPPS